MSDQPNIIYTEQAVLALLNALIDQNRAHVIVPPLEPKSGFWFGGGNLVQDADGSLWLCGRYRNAGDSRTGLEAGTRGLMCALFRSTDDGATFEKVKSFTKSDLSRPSAEVISIEGTALHRLTDGTWELFISSEKDRAYPTGFENYQKPGTGVWSIDRLTASSLGAFAPDNLESVVDNFDEPGYLHVKDPVVFDGVGGETVLMFCSHPLSWASSNSGYAVRQPGEDSFAVKSWQLVGRGPIWDVAVTRLTDRMLLPGADQALYFYDGAECMLPLDQNPRGVQRPRGYSCEELGGVMLGSADTFPEMRRLSYSAPLFVSPHGTGSSRYVHTLVTADAIYATWEQSQPDGSQPLVMNRLALGEVRRILS